MTTHGISVWHLPVILLFEDMLPT